MTRSLLKLLNLNDPGWGRGSKNTPPDGDKPQGEKPQGPKGDGPPDLDEMWRDFNRKLNGLFGNKNKGGFGGPSGGGSGGGTGGGSGSDTVLTNDVPLTNLAGATDSVKYYVLTVPAGATTLSFNTSGGTGDADIYVRAGSRPTTTSYTCRPYKLGNTESCAFTNPEAGQWYVLVKGFDAYAGMTLAGKYTQASTGTTVLASGVPVTGLDGTSNSERAFKISVPSGAFALNVALSKETDSTGDADLYVRQGQVPTPTAYDCRPFKSGSNESCTLWLPSGEYFVNVRGYSAYKGVTLKATLY